MNKMPFYDRMLKMQQIRFKYLIINYLNDVGRALVLQSYLLIFLLLFTCVSLSAQRLFTNSPVIIETECDESYAKETELSLNRSDVLDYLWRELSTGTSSTESRFRVTRSGLYAVQILTTPDSLRLSDTVQVIFDAKCCRIIIPTAFTPNGDGRNDLLRPVKPQNCTITSFEMQVFNRWGKLVFQSNDADAGWDGKDAPAHLYVLWLRYTAIGNNNEYSDMLRGDVTLLR
ncbi:MAG TPA: gliding motility-associated C-terminal domain-containing protein [Saprospiraceae bacterium]|nr:gliding motility-associated C-terminal domain-containing protein [Saprospiraceae bacterium]